MQKSKNYSTGEVASGRLSVEFPLVEQGKAFLVPGGRDSLPSSFCKADLELLHRFDSDQSYAAKKK
jgi:hypothetical protein